MDINIDHSGKRVLVAGGGHPVERAIAEAFEALGARVLELVQPAATASSGIEAWRDSATDAVEKLGGLDVLVTYTGIQATGLIEEATLDTWEAGFSRPLKAAFFATQAAVPALTETRGAVVNVTSVLGQMGARAGLAIPAAAMACVVHHTRMLALRLGKDGVRVNCVCHGYLSELEGAGLRQRSGEGASSSIALAIPLGRLARPNDITGPVLFLASPLAAFVTGAILADDGGTFAGS